MSNPLQPNRAPGLVGRFARNDHGNIAVLFSIALLPILGFVGAAVDYTRASATRASMQSALDSAALMVSKDNAAGDLSSSQLTTKAQAYFNALFTSTDANNVVVTASYSNSASAGQRITMTGSGSINTDFMKVAGFPTIGFNTTSTTSWGTTKLRVALALDNTGSMASNGKMTAMQTAAQNLIDQLKASVKSDGDVLISVVPFANVVNIGSGYRNSGYIDWSNWSTRGSIEENYSCGTYNQTPTYFNGYNGVMKCGSSNNTISSWNGCIMDRNQNYDVSVTPPGISGTTGTNYYADQSSYCPQPIMPLSSDWTGLKANIAAQTPAGGTNQPIGMVWAWQTLQQSVPMNAPAEDPNYTYKKAIILLSDGLNTMDRWPSYGNGNTQFNGQIDARQQLLCDNIKAAGVTIYTIQVNTDGDPTSTILSNCASSSANFFMLTSANQILSTFNSIGTSLAKLRITQ